MFEVVVSIMVASIAIAFVVLSGKDVVHGTKRFIRNKFELGFFIGLLALTFWFIFHAVSFFNFFDKLDENGVLGVISHTSNIIAFSITLIVLFLIWIVSVITIPSKEKKSNLFISKKIASRSHVYFHNSLTILVFINLAFVAAIIATNGLYKGRLFDVRFNIASMNMYLALSNDGFGNYGYALDVHNSEGYPLLAKVKTIISSQESSFKISEDFILAANVSSPCTDGYEAEVLIPPSSKKNVPIFDAQAAIPNLFNNPTPEYLVTGVRASTDQYETLCSKEDRFPVVPSEVRFQINWISAVSLQENRHDGKIESFIFSGQIEHVPNSFYDCRRKTAFLTTGIFKEEFRMYPTVRVEYDDIVRKKNISSKLITLQGLNGFKSNNDYNDPDAGMLKIAGMASGLTKEEADRIMNDKHGKFSDIDLTSSHAAIYMVSDIYNNRQKNIWKALKAFSQIQYPLPVAALGR